MTPTHSPTLASQATAELPKLPQPYSVKSTIKCTACGAPYAPPMTLAGGAAQWPGGLLPPHACRCGNTQFGGTVSSESLSPAQFTADQMNAHYLAGYEAGRASRAQSEWISVEDRLPDTSRRVLACNPLGYVGAAQYVKGHWNGIGGASGWMELPETIAPLGGAKS